MANPSFLICDADALIQLLTTECHEPLRMLARRFAIKPLVLDVVAIELRCHRRHHNVPAAFEKALAKGLLFELREDTVADHLGPGRGGLSLWEAIVALSAKYELAVDRGEAHSIAAALELEVPLMSNDGSAMRVLRNRRMQLPKHVLRSFDVLVLAVQTKTITTKFLGRVVGRLRQAQEGVPVVFQAGAADVALTKFETRCHDTSCDRVAELASFALALDPLPSRDGGT